jgi:hypothetical protein
MRPPDPWARFVTLLPTGTDQAWFRGELERIGDISRDALVTELQHCREREQYWRTFAARDLPELQLSDPERTTFAARIHERAEAFKWRADYLTRHESRWQWWRFIELCVLAERVRIDLGYTTPRKGPPRGPGIRYLMAASKLIGKPIYEHRARDILKYFAHMEMAEASFGGKVSFIAKPTVIRADGVILDD